ncbi:MAG: SocA family protein [Acidobacteria bacterium]|nr:SocA family protein [Acidobacteriota bacterium]
MASVHDLAAYILRQTGPVTAMKLQKLVYYCQAWSLVWEERPLFRAKIEAWADGPVVPQLYRLHRGTFKISKWPQGNPEVLSEDDRSTIDAVLKFYGDKTSQWLSDLTHMEKPWREARRGVPPGAPCRNEITAAGMAEYYGSL